MALRFHLGPMCSQKITETLRTGGKESISPGTGTARGSRALVSPRGVLLAGTRGFPHWRGKNSPWGSCVENLGCFFTDEFTTNHPFVSSSSVEV